MKDYAKKDRLLIRVNRAPGMNQTVVEVNNTDPSNPAAWRELDSSGALHVVPSPAKGTWWARAASRTTKEKSAFTTPVYIVVNADESEPGTCKDRLLIENDPHQLIEGMMIAAKECRVVACLIHRRSAELSAPHNQRAIE